MSRLLYTLARWCFRHRWATVASWLAVLVAVVAVAGVLGGRTTEDVSIPGTESQQVITVLKQKLPVASGASTQVVFATQNADVTSADNQRTIENAVRDLGAVPQVVAVYDPFRTGSVSPDHRVALAQITWNTDAGNVKPTSVDRMEHAVAQAQKAGVTTAFSGQVYPKASVGMSAEAIGLVVALAVLALTFGSMVAGGLPIVTALIGMVISLTGISIVAAFTDIPSSSTSVATMLGLSCTIDYALFVFSRHRTNILAGHSPEEACGRSAGTAGGSVLFAGLSVIVALCGLTVVGIPFLTVMGLTAAAAVALSLLAALTLLPALLGFLGPRAVRFSRLPGLRRARAAGQDAVSSPERLAGTRWAGWVVRHRAAVLVVGVIATGLAALPVLKMDLGLPGANARPASDTSRVAYDLTTEHFGPGYNDTLTVLAEHVASKDQAATVASDIARMPGVVSSQVAIVAGDIALVSVVPATGPNDPKTADLVHAIRDHRAAIEADSGATVLVGGQTAMNIDTSQKLSQALPVFLLVIIGLAFVLLTFAFRTILVPIKSILGFLLSAGAALGAEVAVFQWGWGKDLLGVEPTQTLSFLPVILLAVMFGLSSDYEIFVVSRIKEHYTRTGNARESAIAGTGLSARVVTAAALIMASIFASFLFAPDPMLKSIGFSFAVGVLVDAFVVRLALVPAIMAIAGSKIWYHPRWFGTRVPDPDIEGERLEAALAHEHPAPAAATR